MSSYLVTGASRGIGYAFILERASIPGNTVIGLVRNKKAVEERLNAENVQNVHIVEGDLTDLKSLKKARAEIEQITTTIDYLINNAGGLASDTAWKSLSEFEDKPEVLEKDLMRAFETNVLGTINVINTFLPLVKRSMVKKIIAISTGLADPDLANKYGIWENAPYSISKAALNMAVAKYNARHQKDGILFLAISPGIVATGNEVQKSAPTDGEMGKKVMTAFPNFRGPITPEESVKSMLKVIDQASASNEFAGAFVSHRGTKEWV